MQREIKRLICKLFGHKYRLHRKITNTIREVGCKRCKQLFAMNDSVKALVPMDGEFLNLHEEILQHGRVIQNSGINN